MKAGPGDVLSGQRAFKAQGTAHSNALGENLLGMFEDQQGGQWG